MECVRTCAFLLPLGILASVPLAWQRTETPGTVLSHQKISALEGGFGGGLANLDQFGHPVAVLGDVDGDGIQDMAVGAFGDGEMDGAVWILFLNRDGTVRDEHRLADGSGGFRGETETFFSCFAVGDLDRDGIPDLAVGDPTADDGAVGAGALWLLCLNRDGSVRAQRKISATSGGFDGPLAMGDLFGTCVVSLGDLDGDGNSELAVGASTDRDGGFQAGAVWVLFLNANGTVRESRKLSGSAGDWNTNDRFGSSVTNLGDLDRDGVPDLAVGAPGYDLFERGAVWIVFLRRDGTMKSSLRISEGAAGFTGATADFSAFGAWVGAVGDLDGDGVSDLAVGHPKDDDGGSQRGAVWILFLNHDGSVKSEGKISDTRGGFTGELENRDRFGNSVTSLGDLDGDGVIDLAVSAVNDDDGGSNRGAIWVLFLDGIGTLDFEGLDNGRSLRASNPFESLVAIDSIGANHGPALFDSTPGGPNDPGADPDLLVDRGNVLMLQEDPTQTEAGVFDFPDDSRFGGTLSFEFTSPVELYSVDLIDICPDPGQDALLTLTDSNGEARVYLIPSGWTSDVTMEGTGVGTLDLTALGAQEGFAAFALASETAGFAARDVVRLEVCFSSSAALDNLVFDPRPRTTRRTRLRR